MRWWLSDSVEKQFEAFAKGLLTLCGGPALQLFSPTELERLVCGTPCLDFEGLEKAAKYDGGFHPEHRVVRWLWQVIGRLNNDEKKSFLKFVDHHHPTITVPVLLGYFLSNRVIPLSHVLHG